MVLVHVQLNFWELFVKLEILAVQILVKMKAPACLGLAHALLDT